jgi:hypothetical protein
MKPCVTGGQTVLSLAPCVRGIGFIFFDRAGIPLNWGILWTTGDKNKIGLKKVGHMLDLYRPDILVIERTDTVLSNRAPRVLSLLRSFANLAYRRNIPVSRQNRHHAQQNLHLLGGGTKHEAASILAQAFPELQPHLPPKRKIWLPESANMSIFDATVLALAYYSDVARGSP